MKTNSIEGYEFGEQIAEGEMCDVFLATRLKDNLKVVIKLIRLTDIKSTQRVIREQRLLQELNHPNIVKVLKVGCLGVRPYLVLEYVEGKSVRDLIRNQSPLSIELTEKIIRQIAWALSALHARNIIHRDIKPENILLDSNGDVKLIDLSISTKIDEQGILTGHSESVGTSEYMSPEQRSGNRVDKRTDQFSLAVVAFEMLTGHFALGQFRRPSVLNPELDCAMDNILIKGMEQEPSDRYSSVEGFARALRYQLSSPPSPWQNVSSTRVAVTALVCLVLVVSYSLFLYACNVPGKNATLDFAQKGISSEVKRLESFSNSVGMDLVQVPAGEFEFGTSTEQLEALLGKGVSHPFSSEAPRRTIVVTKAFWIGISEVSVKQFRVFVEETGYETTSEKWARENGRNLRQPIWKEPAHFDNHDDLPVIAVSWEDANNFCKWLSEREGKTYRLPTEVEWEYACRAGTSGHWSCSENALPEHATFGRRWRNGPGKICSKRPNPWGIHDMHGNVWEWCHDEFPNDQMPTSVMKVSFREPTEALHVVRGGAYKAPPVTIRSSSRRGFSDYEPVTDRGHGIGFRVLMETPPKKSDPANDEI